MATTSCKIVRTTSSLAGRSCVQLNIRDLLIKEKREMGIGEQLVVSEIGCKLRKVVLKENR